MKNSDKKKLVDAVTSGKGKEKKTCVVSIAQNKDAKNVGVSTGTKFGTENAVITYKSSNNKIASVSAKGTVTAKGKGNFVITTTVKLSSGQKVINKTKLAMK